MALLPQVAIHGFIEILQRDGVCDKEALMCASPGCRHIFRKTAFSEIGQILGCFLRNFCKEATQSLNCDLAQLTRLDVVVEASLDIRKAGVR